MSNWRTLTGMHWFFGAFFYTTLLSFLLLEIINTYIPAIYTIGFFVLLLIVEVIGVARKGTKGIGDTLSESLWALAGKHKSRRWFTVGIGLAIGFKIVSFGFLYDTGIWQGFNTLLEVPPWQHSIFWAKGSLVLYALGFFVWIFSHFLHGGTRG